MPLWLGVASISSASAATSILYAYASGTAVTPTSCPMSASQGDECNLAQAVALATPSTNVIYLETPGVNRSVMGDPSHYTFNAASPLSGGISINAAPFSSSAPLTIESDPNLSSPAILDGDTTYETPSMLTVTGAGYVNLANFTMENGYGGTDGNGAAIDNGDFTSGATIMVSGMTFASNHAAPWDGGAISNDDDGGSGVVNVSDSTFVDNTAVIDGGAIDTGDYGGTGTVNLSDTTFVDNSAGVAGGAVDNGYTGDGSGTLNVVASTFLANTVNGVSNAVANYKLATVSGNLFGDSCVADGTWNDAGYNAGVDTSCQSATPGTDDVSGAGVDSYLTPLEYYDGASTETLVPTTGSPAIGLIPADTNVMLGAATTSLCAGHDQAGTPATGVNCDAGSVFYSTLAVGTTTISGSPIEASTLQADPGTWTTGTALTYQWYANATPISLATSSSFVVTSAQLGDNITVAVTGTLAGYATATVTSSPTAVVQSAPVRLQTFSHSPRPVIVRLGSRRLVAEVGNWGPGVTFTFRWYANGHLIRGSTQRYLSVGALELRKVVTVQVTATKAGYVTLSRTCAKGLLVGA